METLIGNVIKNGLNSGKFTQSQVETNEELINRLKKVVIINKSNPCDQKIEFTKTAQNIYNYILKYTELTEAQIIDQLLK